MPAPKLFVSYSWSSPEHQQWVIDLSTELRQSGVDVILDKWDLKEGHDAVAFMEKMVTDSEIKKVIMICDEKYANKANGRDGGVGTETQIISKRVYDEQDQSKFVAVISQKDDKGKPFLPVYYSSRIFIDLSEADRYAENFEQLLRWIFDKPLYVKPEIGNPPSFLFDAEHISLGTTALFKRCIDAIKNNKPFALGVFNDYCCMFSAHIELFRLPKDSSNNKDAMLQSIEDFIPYRNETIQIFVNIAQYTVRSEFTQQIHRFFESLIPYLDRPANVYDWVELDGDNFRFIIHELFLYAIAVLLKFERFDDVGILLNQQYYMPLNIIYTRETMLSFNILLREMPSIERQLPQFGSYQHPTRSRLLAERCKGVGVEWQYLMQADFTAFMRSEIEDGDRWSTWWPHTLPYLGYFNRPFEIFARAASKSYFDKVKTVLGINNPSDLARLFAIYQSEPRGLPQWSVTRVTPSILLGYEHLATRP